MKKRSINNKKTKKNKKNNIYKRKTMTSKSKKAKKVNGVYKFSDHREFTPNHSPQ